MAGIGSTGRERNAADPAGVRGGGAGLDVRAAGRETGGGGTARQAASAAQPVSVGTSLVRRSVASCLPMRFISARSYDRAG